jgi:O-antigen/teichoic acid export membrane protein
MFGELKSIVKHFLIYGFGSVLNKALAFFLIPVYTRYLTPAQYGTYSLLELTTFIIEIFLGLGISQSIIRFYHEYDNAKNKKEIISSSFLMSVAICAVGLAVMIFLSENLSLLVFRSVEYKGFFRIALVTLFFSMVGEIPLTYMRIKEKSILYTLISLASTIVSIVLNIIFVVLMKLEILGILYGILITTGITSIILSYKMLKEVRFGFSIRKAFEIIKYGAPYIPGGIGMFVLHFGDRFFLERYGDLTEVGLYSLGYKFGMLLQFVVFQPFMQIWGPKRFEIAKKQNGENVIAKIFTYYCLVQILVGLAISLLTKEALKIIAGASFQRAHEIVPVIVLSYIILASYFHIQIGILIAKKTIYIAIIMAISAISNILLCQTLIPLYQSMGAAFATLGSFSIMFVINYFISRKCYTINYELWRIIKIISIATGIFIIGKQIDLDSLILNIITKVIMICIFPIILKFMKFYTLEEIELIKSIRQKVIKRGKDVAILNI